MVWQVLSSLPPSYLMLQLLGALYCYNHTASYPVIVLPSPVVIRAAAPQTYLLLWDQLPATRTSCDPNHLKFFGPCHRLFQQEFSKNSPFFLPP